MSLLLLLKPAAGAATEQDAVYQAQKNGSDAVFAEQRHNGVDTRTLTLSATQADQTLAATADVDVAATLSATQADQTLAATADVDVAATLSATQADQTLSATADVDVVATLSATQADQTLAATATVPSADANLTLNVTQDGQTLAGTATVLVQASLTATQADNTLSGSCGLPIVGEYNGVYQAQRNGSGYVYDTMSARYVVTYQEGDTLAGTIITGIAATLNYTRPDIILEAYGEVVGEASLNATQAGNTLSTTVFVSGGAVSSLQLNAAQANHTVAASAQSIASIAAFTYPQDDNVLAARIGEEPVAPSPPTYGGVWMAGLRREDKEEEAVVPAPEVDQKQKERNERARRVLMLMS